MNTLLHIDSSATGANSATRTITKAIVDLLRSDHSEIIYRDLDAEPIAHLTNTILASSELTHLNVGNTAIDQFLRAQTLVIGAPMYNFSIPSTLKAWIDRVAVAGKTFVYTENGPVGLSGPKRVILVSARGGLYGDANPSDFQEAYLRQVFGFLGMKNIEIVRAEGVALGAEARERAIEDAIAGFNAQSTPQVSAA